MKLKTRLCSSLMKVLPQTAPSGAEHRAGCALRGEHFSFQLAYCAEGFHHWALRAEIHSPLAPFISCRSVELVPVDYPGQFFDDDYLSTLPGLYPDRLADPEEDPVWSVAGQWRAWWIEVAVPEDCPPGKYEIAVTLSAEPPALLKDRPAIRRRRTFSLEILPLRLPAQTLTVTNWLHADCIASCYRCGIFDERHWQLLENFFRNAAAHGVTLLLTPLFTPPLDTGIGLERPTCQLIGVSRKGGKYRFDFTRFDRWTALAQKCGIGHFEMSHFFTQWGAEFTPKIVAETEEGEKRIFGWDVRADSPEYAEFLDAFLPALTDHLRAEGLQDKVYFHCSDEPYREHLKHYRYAAELLKKYLKGFRIMDAMSNAEFYRLGYVDQPVPCESAVEDFIAAGVPEVWTYYCCSQPRTYPNRFITMPSSRNRILGALLYRLDIRGFLHWGFNFYYTQYSTGVIDPFRTTDAGGGFPGGDAFVVYPGKNGVPEDSLRHEVFREALQDQRALQLLEHFMPRERITAMLDRATPGGRMNMSRYPRGEAAVLALRRKIDRLLKKFAAEQEALHAPTLF